LSLMKRVLNKIIVLCMTTLSFGTFQLTFAQQAWQNDLTPIASTDWNYNRAAHLLERAGFVGTSEQIQALAAMPVEEAVRRLVFFDSANNPHLQPFDHSGVYEPGRLPLNWPRR
jgi:hypothetical protein